MPYTAATLFSGGGLSDAGLQSAGFTPIWGVEIDHDIADVYEHNLGRHIIRASVEDVDPLKVRPVDLLWASPVCKLFSNARSKSLPSDGSEDLGLACIPFIKYLRPRAFVLENVNQYIHSEPFRRIVAALQWLGYFVDWSLVNSADLGVPQTRVRLILRAMRESMLPPLPEPVPWRGWYQAIEDLIPDLPDAEFAPWQLKRLNVHPVYGPVLASRPGFVIPPHAFIVDCTTSSHQDDHGNRVLTIRPPHEPMFTVVAQANRTTIRAMVDIKDGIPGKVVNMSTRALARFMTLPDSYVLPTRRETAVKILGQGVPCLMAQRIGEQIREVLHHIDASA